MSVSDIGNHKDKLTTCQLCIEAFYCLVKNYLNPYMKEGGSFAKKFTFYQQENEKSAIETIHYLFFISLEDNLYLIDITSHHRQQSGTLL